MCAAMSIRRGRCGPPAGVQRGSVLNVDGDPSTPGYPSTAGAKRLTLGPDGHPAHSGDSHRLRQRGANCCAIFAARRSRKRGRAGSHSGIMSARARCERASQCATTARRTAYKKIYDTFGVVRGSEFPDEVVIVGGHRDGWGPGTADNVSGTVSVLEAARAVAEQVKAGHRPKRTIVFATWDAEEWGLIGSTEYVEDDSLRLLKNAARISIRTSRRRACSSAAAVRRRCAPRCAASPTKCPTRTAAAACTRNGGRASQTPDGAEPAMGDPGGGSDFAGFYNHLGIPIAEWGFGGPGGVYHSQYDDFAWMSKFGDPGLQVSRRGRRVSAPRCCCGSRTRTSCRTTTWSSRRR